MFATKPDLPTPVKKIVVPERDAARRVCVNLRVWEKFRLLKKKLRWICCDLKRLVRVCSLIWGFWWWWWWWCWVSAVIWGKDPILI